MEDERANSAPSEDASKVFGNLIREVYRFATEGQFSPRHIVRSPINAYESMPATRFFSTYGPQGHPRYLVKSERLPSDPNICAIAFQRGRVYVETTKVDLRSLGESLQRGHLPAELRGKSVYHEGRKIVPTRTQNMGTTMNRDIRTVLTLPFPEQVEDLDVAIQVADLMYNQTCFAPLPDEVSDITAVAAASPKLRLEMRPELLMLIEQRQQPKLLHRMDLNLYHLQRIIAGGKVLQMNSTQLGEHVRQQLGNNPALTQ